MKISRVEVGDRFIKTTNKVEVALHKLGDPKPLHHPLLPALWEIWRGEWCLDGEGRREKWATKNFYVLDGRTDAVGEGDTIEEALRDAGLLKPTHEYTKSLRARLADMRDSAMTACALLELSGAVEWAAPQCLHEFLQTTIGQIELALTNPQGELDPPEEEKCKTK